MNVSVYAPCAMVVREQESLLAEQQVIDLGRNVGEDLVDQGRGVDVGHGRQGDEEVDTLPQRSVGREQCKGLRRALAGANVRQRLAASRVEDEVDASRSVDPTITTRARQTLTSAP